MSAFGAPIRYFLGAQTPAGFVTTTDDLYAPADGWRVYLLKGGAGTGKSGLLRRAYAQLVDAGEEVEVFCCSADPASLDAIRCEARKLFLLDATAPHAVEPQYWGAVEQPVALFTCTDESRLHPLAPQVIELTDACRDAHTRVRRHLQAAASLLADNRRDQLDALLPDKIRHTARSIARREWDSETSSGGQAKRRFLSAVTPEGIVTLYGTLQTLCSRIYTIEDDYGAAADCLLGELTRLATAAGLDCLCCPCPLFPQGAAQHLLIPSLGLGFTTSNRFHKADFPVYRRLHATRFADTDMLDHKRQRLRFRQRAATELLSAATAAAAEAKGYHDRLEQLNGTAVNWTQYEELVTAFLQNI